MYLSRLRLNPRSKQAITEVSRPYELHRTLMKAFPDREAGPGRILFRVDKPTHENSIWLLVQSQDQPDWEKLEARSDYLLAGPDTKEYDPEFSTGQMLYFRLRANPTVKRGGKRYGVMGEEAQIEWLNKKGQQGGFEPTSVIVTDEGMASDCLTDGAGQQHTLSLLAVRFEGVLRITDQVLFGRTVHRGIGSGKGLGFGMLSIAPIKR